MKRGRYLFLATLVILGHRFARVTAFDAVAAQRHSIEVLPFFNLVEIWNRGISFGMLHGLAYGQWLLSGLSMVISLILLRWLFRTSCPLTATALGLIIGGSTGNIIDRMRFGAVADYLDFHAFGHHWPAFNVTDCAIFIGAIMLIYRPR